MPTATEADRPPPSVTQTHHDREPESMEIPNQDAVLLAKQKRKLAREMEEMIPLLDDGRVGTVFSVDDQD